jgi:dihydropyrimidinase
VVWDEREFVLRNAERHHDVDDTPCEGRTLRAWPGLTIARGEVVWDNGQFHGRAGHGRFLRCDAPSLLPRR